MKILETPDLLELQKLPYERFTQIDVDPERRKAEGLEELFRKIFPIESDNGKHRIEYVHYVLEDPVDTIDECIEKKSSYESRLRVRLKIITSEQDAKSKEMKVKEINEQDIYLGSLPLMTESGSFIINGIERVVVNQLLRCPGVYFKEEPSIGQNSLYSAKIYPSRGLWIEFEVDNHNCLIVWMGKKKVYATVLLKALGYNDDEIKNLFYGKPENVPQGSVIANTLARDDTRTAEEALKRIYKEMRPGYDKVNIKEAAKFLNMLLFSDEVYDLSEPGRRQVNKVLNLSFRERYLRKEDIVETIHALLNLIEKKEGVIQDIDHLGNKRVRTSAEIVKEHIYEGLVKLKRYAREKMVLLDKDESKKVTLQLLINGKILMTAVNDFFARNQLSQFLEKTNPLTEITHKRRVTAVGEGGVKERKRASFEVRDVHYTHFGKICPIETPEGANIGLINSLTVHAKVDEMGFIKAPYFKVEKGVVTEHLDYLTADQEDLFAIAPPGVPFDQKTRKIVPELVNVRTKDGIKDDYPRDKVDYIGVSPVQIVSVSASLIPFLEHDDSNRALMGSNMQRQGVPLIKNEAPLVKTGMEKYVIQDSGVVLKAKNDGVVSYVDSQKIVVRRNNPGIFDWEKEDVYYLRGFFRTNQDTCFHQRPIVSAGDIVKKGHLISDGPCSSPKGELSLGKNLLVALMPWHGYNYEDAILLSERLVKEDTFTSIHIKEFEVKAIDTELGAEEITSDLPNTPEERLKNLDEKGIIRIGAEVEPDDILVGKVTPRGESDITPEEKLLRVIFGEKAKDVQNTSLKVPPGTKGTIVNVRKYSRRDASQDKEVNASVKELEEVYAGKEKIISGIISDEIKKFAAVHKVNLKGRFNNPEAWRKLADKFPEKLKDSFMKIVLMGENELGKIKNQLKNEKVKIKRGHELDSDVICKIVVEIAVKKKVSVGDKMSGRHGNKGVVSKVMPEEDMPFLSDGTPVDIVLNPLGVPSRMNIGQVLEIHLGRALKALGYSTETPIFQSIKEMEIKNLLKEAGLPEDGKDILYDGQTGEPFSQKVTVGYMYMMKLKHLADEKIHTRSTGAYSLITQQPLGGRAQFGGQRFGEMEVWALEGYGAAHTLKEMLTVKSDDTEGRKLMYESIAKGLDYRGNNIPESFNVLKKELQGIGLDLKIEKLKDGGQSREIANIKITSPMVMRSWSHGEVKKAETLNYRTFRPEKDGLFCERIFGPAKDYECSCGKYKKLRYKGIICDRCGVEVTTSKVRRERMGHVELATPVSYIWLLKSISNWMGLLLDMSMSDLENVCYYEGYIVIDPGSTPLREKQIMSEDEYYRNLEKYGNKFQVGIGAEAIQQLLKKVDLHKLEVEIKQQLGGKKKKDYITRRNLIKKLRMVEGLIKTQVKPEYMITSILMVTPPDLRPLLPLDGGRFVASDLNDLYQRVINRNNRLKKLIQLQAPDIIVRNEKRMLQESVDALLDNGKHGMPVLGKGKRPLKSLTDALRGKQGRFRQNLLGKRVDYSGRAVIVVGPELKLNQCGLPKEMALELFGPFVLRELRKKEYFHTLGSAKRAIRENLPEVWEILERVSKKHPVMLNRQPTLHRLSIQAFEPKLIEGNVITVHPLVCPAFNADFDGDTMSVHLPLTPEACIEAKLLMQANTHILSPASGKPIATPTRDIVVGCTYLTFQSEEDPYEMVALIGDKKIKHPVPSFEEAVYLYNLGYLTLHRPLKVKDRAGKDLVTTVGRIIFNEFIPEEIEYKNEKFESPMLEALTEEIFDKCGYEKTVEFLDSVKNLGFEFTTKGGITIGIDDLKIPAEKGKIIREAEEEKKKVEKNYGRGILSSGERYNRIIDIWTTATNKIGRAVMDTIAYTGGKGAFYVNPIYLMVSSGARGNRSQANQLMGMRGLMIRPTKQVTGSIGEIIETPVISNFREGLDLLEYYIAIHGGRKGLVDTALKTSDAGYLSRRLIDVAHSVIVSEDDCGTLEGIFLSSLTDGEDELLPLKERIVGRVAVDNVVDIVTDRLIVKAGELIDEQKAQEIVDTGINRIRIRSVLTCKAEKGVCAKCYGWDVSRKKLVNIGEAVGVIAAQSIGEPGTQLTLRTFHTGGAASRSTASSSIKARDKGIIKYPESLRIVKNSEGKNVVINREGTLFLNDERGREIERYTLRVGTILHVKDGETVTASKDIASLDPYSFPIIADKGGKVVYKDIELGKTAREEFDSKVGISSKVIVQHKEEMDPQIILKDGSGHIVGNYHLPEDAHVIVQEGGTVYPGDVVAKILRSEKRVQQDITGGLPRVSELFEARNPKNPAIISEIDGLVEILPSEKGSRKIRIVNEETETVKDYVIPYNKHLLVAGGDRVLSGSKLTDGPIVLKDMLRIQGEKKVEEYLLSEIQKVYRVEGVTIKDKHIEVIVKQMLSKVRVEDPGDTFMLEGEEIDKIKIQKMNETLPRNKRAASYKPMILGITRVALSSESFISAASFQETTKVLTASAMLGLEDPLEGLKENVILGRLIPAGTGMFKKQEKDEFREVAEHVKQE